MEVCRYYVGNVNTRTIIKIMKGRWKEEKEKKEKENEEERIGWE